MSTSTITSPTAAAAAQSTKRFSWKLYVFEVRRKPGKGRATMAAVPPRRVAVYAPYDKAAAFGAGANQRDEVQRLITPRPWHRWRYARKPTLREVADFYEAVGSLLERGNPLTNALNTAARMVESPMMRGIIGTLQDAIAGGEDLHRAMRWFPRVFTPMQIAMVEAASETGIGKSGALFKMLASRLNKRGRGWRKLLASLAYPLSLIVLTLIGTIILEIWALPPMVELFKTLGGTLPWITQAFYNVAQVLREHVVLVFTAIIGGAVALAAWAPALAKTRPFQVLAIRSPYIGPAVQWMSLYDSLGTFLLLKSAGAAVRDQFTMAAAASGNCVVASFYSACYERIVGGETVEEAFTAERHRLGKDGPRLAGKMEVVMSGGDLVGIIGGLIAEFEERADNRLAMLPNMIRWPMLIVACAMIGSVALAIVLPYPSLIADVAHQQAVAAFGK